MHVRRTTPSFVITRLTFAVLLFFTLIVSVRPAFAGDNDRVSFAQRIVVDENETTGDLVCFLCAVEVHGHVEGDVVSFLGGVKNDGVIQGDVVSFLGNLNLSGTGSIGGDVVVMGGNLRKSEDARLGKDRVVFPVAIFLIPFLILGAIVWGISRIFRRPPVYFPTPGR
jgi:hypothetical protein